MYRAPQEDIQTTGGVWHISETQIMRISQTNFIVCTMITYSSPKLQKYFMNKGIHWKIIFRKQKNGYGSPLMDYWLYKQACKYIIKSSIDIQMFKVIIILRLEGLLLFLLLVFVRCVGHCTYMKCWQRPGRVLSPLSWSYRQWWALLEEFWEPTLAPLQSRSSKPLNHLSSAVSNILKVF